MPTEITDLRDVLPHQTAQAEIRHTIYFTVIEQGDVQQYTMRGTLCRHARHGDAVYFEIRDPELIVPG